VDVHDTEWCVLVRVSSGLRLWEAVLRNTSGTIPRSLEWAWNLLPVRRVTAVLAAFQVRPSIMHCRSVLMFLICDFMIRSWIWGGTYSLGVHGTIIVDHGRNLHCHSSFCRLPYISSFASSILVLSVNRTRPVGERF
jgi:hypothetical protein